MSGDKRLLLRHGSKTVLDEDDYLSALGRIIERDYFPHSQQLHAHLQMLHEADRLGEDVGNARVNSQRIEALLQRVKTEQRSLQHMHMSPRASEPVASAGGEDDPYAHHTVDSFLASHTSEDNASFEALQLRDQAERRRKMHWLYEPGEDAEYTRRAALMDPTAMLLLTNGAQAGAAAPSSSTAGQKPGMLMLYYKGGTQLSVSQRADLDRRLDAIVLREGGNGRSARPEGSKFRVRNHLMFAPDSDSTHDAGSSGANGSSSSSSASSFGNDKSRGNNVGLRAPKILQRGNTAMPGSTTELIRSLVSSGEASAVERPHSPSVYSDFSGYSGYTEGLEAGPEGMASTAARRYRPVPMSPHREAGKNGDEPPVTWGVVGLPLLLDEGSRFGFIAPLGPVASSSSRLPTADLFADEGAGDGSLHFSMSLSKREALAHGLDRMARRRESKEGGPDKKGKRQKDRDKERRGEGRSAAAVALAARISGAHSGTGLSIAPTPFCEASLLRASYGGGTVKRGSAGEHSRTKGAGTTPAPLSSSSSATRMVPSAAFQGASKITADDMRGLLRL